MSRTSYDLVIVGGGPAGISTALHLIRHAPDVAANTVIVEKERYPRDKYCAGAVASRALRALEAIEARPDVPQVVVNGMTLAFGEYGASEVREPGLGVVIRRIEFDHALARIAMERGMELRQGSPVQGLDMDGDRVRVRLAGGDVLVAKAVVGADGVGGVVRRAAGFGKGKLRAQVVELDTEPTVHDPPGDTLHFDFRFHDFNGYLWDFPTIVDGRRMVCRGAYFVRDRGPDDVRRRLEQWLQLRDLDIDDYKLKQFAERGFEFDEPISRPHVILVGEAAGIDVATGEGIPQAIAYGEIAAGYLIEAFRSGDFAFRDWFDRVRGTSLGRRLAWRQAAYKAFFSSERTAMERFTATARGLVQVGAQDFAGKALSGADLARGLAQLAPLAVKTGPGPLLRIVKEALGDERWANATRSPRN